MTTQSEVQSWNPEHALIATLLLDGDTAAISLASEEVSPADFKEERFALTYEAILALDAAGRRVDLVTVAETLKAQGLLSAVGGPAFLASLDNPPFPNVIEHARLIREKGARRQLRRVSLEVAELSKADTLEILPEQGFLFEREQFFSGHPAGWGILATVNHGQTVGLDFWLLSYSMVIWHHRGRV